MKILTRILLILLVVTFSAYSAAWFYFAQDAKKEIETVVASADPNAVAITYTDLSVTGFPLAFDVEISDLNIKMGCLKECEHQQTVADIAFLGVISLESQVFGKDYYAVFPEKYKISGMGADGESHQFEGKTEGETRLALGLTKTPAQLVLEFGDPYALKDSRWKKFFRSLGMESGKQMMAMSDGTPVLSTGPYRIHLLRELLSEEDGADDARYRITVDTELQQIAVLEGYRELLLSQLGDTSSFPPEVSAVAAIIAEYLVDVYIDSSPYGVVVKGRYEGKLANDEGGKIFIENVAFTSKRSGVSVSGEIEDGLKRGMMKTKGEVVLTLENYPYIVGSIRDLFMYLVDNADIWNIIWKDAQKHLGLTSSKDADVKLLLQGLIKDLIKDVHAAIVEVLEAHGTVSTRGRTSGPDIAFDIDFRGEKPLVGGKPAAIIFSDISQRMGDIQKKYQELGASLKPDGASSLEEMVPNKQPEVAVPPVKAPLVSIPEVKALPAESPVSPVVGQNTQRTAPAKSDAQEKADEGMRQLLDSLTEEDYKYMSQEERERLQKFREQLDK